MSQGSNPRRRPQSPHTSRDPHDTTYPPSNRKGPGMFTIPSLPPLPVSSHTEHRPLQDPDRD